MRLLIVEDDKDVSDFLKDALEKECFVVDVSASGKTGAFWACTNDYDLVILDHGLPEKNGFEICREIRAAGKTVPILMLSIQSEVPTKVQLLEEGGADDYLTKPFAFRELLARVRSLLRRPAAIANTILAAGDLRLDATAHTVARGDKEIRLRNKEFMLLEYLLRHAGELVTRGKILEHAWDVNADPMSNTVETHMTNLRRKIGDTDQKLIHTVSGLGYKLTAPTVNLAKN